MSISGNRKRRRKKSRKSARRSLNVYLAAAAFCLVFCLIYNQFAHGVHSPYMQFLFAWPLVLGTGPSLFFWKMKRIRLPGKICYNAWNSGVAALTMSSLLRGIFEIAGTSSRYQSWMMTAGFVLLAAGVAAYFADGFITLRR